MIIIGEKLNSSIPKTYEAMKSGDWDYIKNLAISQEKSGAHFLDVNAAMFQEKEGEILLRILDIILENTNCGIMIDSPSPDAIMVGIQKASQRKTIINSVTLTDRFDDIMPIVKEFKCGVVGLPIAGSIPTSSVERVKNATDLIEKIKEFGINDEDIYIDALVEAVATSNDACITTIDTIREIKNYNSNVHVICGASNVSFGLPKRGAINSAFLAIAIYNGLDSVILDVTNENIKTTMLASNVVSGNDEYCMDYIENLR